MWYKWLLNRGLKKKISFFYPFLPFVLLWRHITIVSWVERKLQWKTNSTISNKNNYAYCVSRVLKLESYFILPIFWLLPLHDLPLDWAPCSTITHFPDRHPVIKRWHLKWSCTVSLRSVKLQCLIIFFYALFSVILTVIGLCSSFHVYKKSTQYTTYFLPKKKDT